MGKIGGEIFKGKGDIFKPYLGWHIPDTVCNFGGNIREFFHGSCDSFLFGGAVSPILISSNTIVHELIPEEAHGRVFSSIEAVVHLAYLVFMLLSALAAEFISSFSILIIVGLVFILSGTLGIRRVANKKKALDNSRAFNIQQTTE